LILLGGHINPAVTVGLLILGEIDIVSAMAYIVTQFIAAGFGAALVWGTMYDSMLSDEQDGGKSTGSALVCFGCFGFFSNAHHFFFRHFSPSVYVGQQFCQPYNKPGFCLFVGMHGNLFARLYRLHDGRLQEEHCWQFGPHCHWMVSPLGSLDYDSLHWLWN
jgi:hypothetical protein